MNELRKNNEATEELIEETIEIKEASKEKYIDWNYLKSINEDIIAWIEIEGTNINYPIIKNENNYYLKHSFDKKYNSNGAIFTTNIFPFKDDETIVYGHNMKNGSMFSNLGKYLNKEFLDLHSKYKIYTVDKNYEATIFSVYSIGVNEEMQNLKLLNFDERVKYYKNISKYRLISGCIEIEYRKETGIQCCDINAIFRNYFTCLLAYIDSVSKILLLCFTVRISLLYGKE